MILSSELEKLDARAKHEALEGFLQELCFEGRLIAFERETNCGNQLSQLQGIMEIFHCTLKHLRQPPNEDCDSGAFVSSLDELAKKYDLQDTVENAFNIAFIKSKQDFSGNELA